MSEKETAPWFRFLNAMNRAGKALDTTQRTVLGALLSYADGPDKSSRLMNARPGRELLACDTGLSVRTVERRLKELEDLGWVTVTSEGGRRGGRGWATSYRLTVPVDKRLNGDNADALCSEERATPVTERATPVTVKGDTHDAPPPHDLLNTSSIKASSSTNSPIGPVDNSTDDTEPASAAEAPAVPELEDGCWIEDHTEDKSEEQRQDMDHDEPDAEENRDTGNGPEAEQLDRLQQQDAEQVPAPPEGFENVPATDEEPMDEGPNADAPAPAHEDHAASQQWAQGETEAPQHHQDATPPGDAPTDALKARRANGDPARLRSITTVSSTALDTPTDVEAERRRQLDALRAKYPETAA